MTILIFLGGALLAVSGPHLFLQGREIAMQHAASRYELESIKDTVQAVFAGHSVVLRDAFTGSHFTREDRRRGPVQILIDGRDYSVPSEVEIRPFYTDANRYWGWVRLVRLVDREKGETFLTVMKLVRDVHPGNISDPRPLRFRLLLVAPDGRVQEEIFSYAERARPLYRVLLANYVSPFSLGFYSEVLRGWPTLLYPILYPWATTLVGVLLVIIGAFFPRRAR